MRVIECLKNAPSSPQSMNTVSRMDTADLLKMIPSPTLSSLKQENSTFSLLNNRKRRLRSCMETISSSNIDCKSSLFQYHHSKKFRYTSETAIGGEQTWSMKGVDNRKKSVTFNLIATTIYCLKRPQYRRATNMLVSEVDSILDGEDSDNNSMLSVDTNGSNNDETNAIWYTSHELKSMKYEAKQYCRKFNLCQELSTVIIFCSKVQDNQNTTGCCSFPTFTSSTLQSFALQRGLERWTSPLHCMERSIHVLVSKTDVFIEQSNQITNQNLLYPDYDKIAQVYHNSSLVSVRLAQFLGILDWQATKES